MLFSPFYTFNIQFKRKIHPIYKIYSIWQGQKGLKIKREQMLPCMIYILYDTIIVNMFVGIADYKYKHPESR